MYKNPLNNGDLSDYNSLKKQQDYGAIIKKYERAKKKPSEATELQKYYQYMTYQQPILDEAIYVAERMKNEDIKKQKEDFEFIQKLKNERENQFKNSSKIEKDLTPMLRNELFDTPIISTDLTPTIVTNVELDNSPTTIEKAASKIQALVKGVKYRAKELPNIIEADLKAKKLKEMQELVKNVYEKGKTAKKPSLGDIQELVKTAYRPSEAAGRGRPAGTPNESTIVKYEAMQRGEKVRGLTKKQIENVKNYLTKNPPIKSAVVTEGFV